MVIPTSYVNYYVSPLQLRDGSQGMSLFLLQ